VSTLLHATVYTFLHNLLNVLVQTANKLYLKKIILLSPSPPRVPYCTVPSQPVLLGQLDHPVY
jgi:hypothetical protein